MATLQEQLAAIKKQAEQVQKTHQELVASGGYTRQGLDKFTGSLQEANKKVSNISSTVQEDMVNDRRFGVPTGTTSNQKITNAPIQQVTTPVPTPTITPEKAQASIAGLTPQQRAGNYANLSAALQNAINLGRAQRQSAELDFLGGVIPEGAVTSSTFTGLLANLNKASNQFTQPLTEQVLEFARDEQDYVRNQQNDIRDLALSMVQAGASQEAVSGVLNATDINSAIAMAAGTLNTTTKNAKIQQVGSNLVKYDDDGNVEVLFTASSSGGGGSSSGGAVNTGFFNSGAVRISDQELGQLAMELENTRGADGFANTQLYVDAFNQWVNNGGLPQDFFKNYEPDYFLNPNDPTIPPNIKGQMKTQTTSSNPFR